MADEKILKDEILEEDQLDNVAGGTHNETLGDGAELVKRGLLSKSDIFNYSAISKVLHDMGYGGYKDNNDITTANIYINKDGTQISRAEFWKNFDAENGTRIIYPRKKF